MNQPSTADPPATPRLPGVKDPVKISAIVCTRDRPALARGAVDSILRNRCPGRFEVIVVDQSDDSRTEQALGDVLGRIRYVRSMARGAGSARNTGARLAAGELLAFTDDDCEVSPDWLAAAIEALRLNPEASLCHGTVAAPRGDSDKQGGGTPAMIVRERRLVGGRHTFRLAGMTANLIVRRSAFDQLGGFDEALGPGAPLKSAEDFDLQLRAHGLRLTTLLEPTMKVTHHGYRTQAEWRGLCARDGYGVGAFLMKHIRCGDWLAFRVLLTITARETARGLKGLILRRDPSRALFVTALARGACISLRYSVDRRERRFLPRGTRVSGPPLPS